MNTHRERARRHTRNVGWSLGAEGVRLITATSVFLILTHRYPPGRYGVLVGVLGLLGFLVPQATVGSSYLVLQRIAGQGWDPLDAARRALGTAALGGLVVTALLVALRPWVLPQVDAGTMLLLGISELVLGGMAESVSFVAQAQERLRSMAATRMVFGASRLVAAVTLLTVSSSPPIVAWAALAGLASGFSLLVAQSIVLTHPVMPSMPRRSDLREGLPFSLGFSADKLRDSADSVLLIRLNRTVDAGVYGAGLRIVGVATIPVFSLVQAFNARFFRDGQDPAAVMRLTRRITAAGLVFAVPIGAVLALGADLIVSVMPADYVEVAPVLRALAVIPALLVLEVFPAMALTAIGRHTARMSWNLVTAAVNVVLDLWWIPEHGWRGAIAATILTASAYIVILWLLLSRAVRSSSTQAAVTFGDEAIV